MAGLFIGLNPIVIVRQSGGRRVTVHRSRERVAYKGPLVIMLNRYSASASEILAGAMHDYQRALLVGDTTTFGKGTVQNIFQLPEGYGALKVTIAQFYRVSGWSTQSRGVETSIVLPSLNNVREIGESTLDNALPWRSIDQVSYRPKGSFKSVLPALKQLSKKRMKDSKYFQNVDKDVHEFMTSIKPMKYTSILKMQEDDSRQKAERELDLSNAIKNETTEEVRNIEEKKEFQADAYIRESMAIIADYINLQQTTK
jgi:carboxyl-terminal processing protease